jgi:molybdenum cofactor cytidylyltransferase
MTTVIILAAGTSTRLGRAKQTLHYKGHSLLKHTIKAAVDSGVGSVVVVIGANEQEISTNIENEPVAVVFNKSFPEGISSSIKAGVNYVIELNPQCENIILMVCDQPHVDGSLLRKLLDAKLTTNQPIVACSYSDTIGVPALFGKSLFPELLSLKGEEGGKKVLLKHKDSVAAIPFPSGEIDIDTAADYDELIRSKDDPALAPNDVE